jgi:hypothetical protein
MAANEELVAKAQQLYVSYYGRPADPAGLDFWIDYFANTDSVDKALVDFGTSEEYVDWIEDNGLDTSEKLIAKLYQQMFKRDPEEEGLAFYVDQLENGAASLASIALDVANGAQNEDITILNNKIAVANDFTNKVAAGNKFYTSSYIHAAQTALAIVGESGESVADGTGAGDAVIASMPTEGPGGEFTQDEDNPVGDYSGQSASVTVTLEGDEDEADFDVLGSKFDDAFILEEFRTAKINGNLVSCPVNSLYFRACRERCSKARSAGNTGCICKGRNAAAALSAGSRRARQPRPLAALHLLTRATAIACKARLARNLGWRAEMQRINRTGH